MPWFWIDATDFRNNVVLAWRLLSPIDHNPPRQVAAVWGCYGVLVFGHRFGMGFWPRATVEAMIALFQMGI
jgi:hypothetical protein